MREHILQVPRPTLREATLDGNIQGVKRAGTVIMFDINPAEIRERLVLSSGRVNQVDVIAGEEPDAVAARVTGLENEIVWQGLLDGQSPFFGVKVAAPLALQCARRNALARKPRE